jgi:hypothetical protein
MRCETCHGLGVVMNPERATNPAAMPTIPCPDDGCIGGVSHCCDGLTACNDPAPAEGESE